MSVSDLRAESCRTLRHDPYQVIEGLAIAAFAVGAARAFLAVKSTFTLEVTRLRRALAEMQAAGLAGDVPVSLVLGPDSYLFGEEKALLEVVEGEEPLPRRDAPYLHGLFASGPQMGWHAHDGSDAGGDAANPTIVNNVETLAVLCHGDLHPLNLLADGDRITVLDWTGAVFAPPSFDVAFTALLLRNPPLVAPAALRPALAAGGALLARRFTRRYARVNPTADLSRLDWYTALHAVRILAELARWVRTGDSRAGHHPWHLMVPGAARVLAAVTGVDVRPA